MNLKRKIFSGLASVGVMAVLLQHGPIEFTAPAHAQTDQQAVNVFANSEYGYCDAKKVGSVWGVNIDQAKVVIGNKIMGNITHLIDADIASTAGRVFCSWEDLQMRYNDAVALGNYWGRQPHEAKTKIENMATEYGKKKLREILQSETGYRISMVSAHKAPFAVASHKTINSVASNDISNAKSWHPVIYYPQLS